MPTLKDAERVLEDARERCGGPPHLNGVRFRWSMRLRRRLAQCDVEQRRIELSNAALVGADMATFVDVVRHELAHLLAGENVWHGRAWRDWFVFIGGSGNVAHAVD